MYTQMKKARRWTERIATEYGYYSNLAGLCGVGSCRAFLYLKSLGYNPKLIVNSDHIFVLAEGHIIDVTASQFDLPDIHTEEFPSSRWFYRKEKSFNFITALCQWQTQQGWSESQIYWNHSNKLKIKNR